MGLGDPLLVHEQGVIWIIHHNISEVKGFAGYHPVEGKREKGILSQADLTSGSEGEI
jgi:hypothetical protein